MADDKRFERMHSAPIFKKTARDTNKAKLGNDDRFGKMMSDSRFRSTPGDIDRYGRNVKSKNKKNAKKEMEQLYDTTDNDDKKKSKKSSSSATQVEDRMEYINRLARGEVSDSDSSSNSSSDDSGSEISESSSDDDDNETTTRATKKQSVLDIPDVASDSDEEVPTGDSSARLAVMHCDWEHMKAEDILVVLQSFCPGGGKVKAVTVYPSDFGLEQMSQEEQHGPQSIWANETDEKQYAPKIYSGIIGDLEKNASDNDSENEDTDKKSKADKGADFKRKKGSVGLVR